MQYLSLTTIKCGSKWIHFKTGSMTKAQAVQTYCAAPTKKEEPKKELTTNTICGSYCGKWNTKKDAIVGLFNHYKRTKGKDFRWYVTWDGYLEWFNVGDRETAEKITSHSQDIITFNVTEDSSGIRNKLTGTYGEGDKSGEVTVKDDNSIKLYGLCIEDGINDICMDKKEMTDYLNFMLRYKALPIYNAHVELPSFYLIEPGKQIIFVNDDYYKDTVWTVVDWKFEDKGGQPVTSLELTTDESVISPANEFEIIRNTATIEVKKSLPEAARVVSVLDKNSLLVERESDKSMSIVRSLSLGATNDD